MMFNLEVFIKGKLAKESMKMSEKVSNLYKQALEAEESESEKAGEDSRNSTFTEERKEEFVNKPLLIDDVSYELKKKAASEKIMIEPHNEKSNGQSQFKMISKQKSQENLETKSVSNSMLKKSEEKEIKVESVQPEEIKQENVIAVQKIQESQEQANEGKVRSEEKRKTWSPKEAQGLEKQKQEQLEKSQDRQQSRKNLEVPKYSDEEKKSIDQKRYSEEQTPQNRDANRYHFYSRGLINGFLTLVIKYEIPSKTINCVT